MATEYLRYDKMVENALRGVVREALRQAAEHGLPGNHHFYLTFRTNDAGVQIPDYLRGQYPSEMTIVLQYQFYGLEVEEEKFGVTLSFNNAHERLVIPLAAITTFADPSVNFALQFQPLSTQEGPTSMEEIEEEVTEEAERQAAKAGGAKQAEDAKMGQVVALDSFRKK
ncbi:SspB family protein [Skermanella pratensis]|uniref:SspB family protein n=1 Tax=Skermanella pratensis TaxID=2233999 RepID=UPI0013014E65|nr:ClpXP protease specificity-enhancing factor SspB [Skermanella pratensis]